MQQKYNKSTTVQLQFGSARTFRYTFARESPSTQQYRGSCPRFHTHVSMPKRSCQSFMSMAKYQNRKVLQFQVTTGKASCQILFYWYMSTRRDIIFTHRAQQLSFIYNFWKSRPRKPPDKAVAWIHILNQVHITKSNRKGETAAKARHHGCSFGNQKAAGSPV